MSGYDIFAWIVLIILIASAIGVFCIAGWLPRQRAGIDGSRPLRRQIAPIAPLPCSCFGG